DPAIRRQAIDARPVPQIVVALRPRYLALMIGPALLRIGEIEAAVRMADDVVRPVEAAALIVVDQRLDRAVRPHAGEAAVVALADDQPALQVEGRAVAADRGAHQLDLAAGRQPVQPVAAQIDEVPEPVWVP